MGESVPGTLDDNDMALFSRDRIIPRERSFLKNLNLLFAGNIKG